MAEGGSTEALGIPGVTGLVEIASTPAAVTYRGLDDAGRVVVVKVLQRQATPDVRSRFEYDQARLAELAAHPDIVTTRAHGYTATELPYLVMDELSGGSLADQVGSGMDGRGVLAVGVKLAGALESAHRRNLIHGDLRPEDVLVTADGEPHLADLGVALVTGIGPDRATSPDRIAHAAPEQLETHIPSTATDVFGLGSVLHALLAGEPAFVRPGDTSPAAVAVRIANHPAPDLLAIGVPAPVVEVIARAMAKRPEERWDSAEAMGHALQQAEVTLGLPITPMTVVGADRNPARQDEPAADAGAPATAPAPGPGSKKPLLIGVGVLAAVAVAAAVALGGGGGGGDGDDDDQRGGFERRGGVELTIVNDDAEVISVGVLESWSEVNGSSLLLQGGSVEVPDLLATEETDGNFLSGEGFDISGLEVTVMEPEVLGQLGVDADAQAVLDDRVLNRQLADQCTRDLPPRDDEVAGFAGLLQRFDGCDGSGLVVFAGIDGDDRALVVEVHLVNEEDEAGLQAVLDSIEIS